jgi:hypothetical protein
MGSGEQTDAVPGVLPNKNSVDDAFGCCNDVEMCSDAIMNGQVNTRSHSNDTKYRNTSTVNRTNDNGRKRSPTNQTNSQRGTSKKISKSSSRSSCYLRILLFLFFAGFIAFLISDTMTNGYVKNTLFAFLHWIEQNAVAGVFVYMVGTYLLQSTFFYFFSCWLNACFSCPA